MSHVINQRAARAAACIVTAALAFVTLIAVPAHATTLVDFEAHASQTIVDLINAEREGSAQPLTAHDDIHDVAYAWSQTMADEALLYHNDDVGAQVDDYISLAENVGWTSVDSLDPSDFDVAVEGMHDSFMNSAGHRANIMNDKYEHVGVGVRLQQGSCPGGPADDYCLWVTEIFRTPARQWTQPAPDDGPVDNPTRPDSPSPDETDTSSDPGNGNGATRHAGSSRTSTAAALSAATFDSADVVLLARSDSYADALAGGPLAAALNAPVLLTPSAELDDATREEISRLGAERVIVLGGSAAVSDTVVTHLMLGGYDVERISGGSRFSTATAIADRLVAETGTPARAWVVEGANANPTRGWPDALSAASAAARLTEPVLLTSRDSLPDDTADWIASTPTDIMIVGGTAAVSTPVEHQIDAAAGTVRRLAGGDRFDTSVKVAQFLTEQVGQLDSLYVATGLNWPDALAAGPAAAANNGMLVLVHGTSTDGGTSSQQFASERRGKLARLHIVGGDSAVSDTVANKYQQLLGL